MYAGKNISLLNMFGAREGKAGGSKEESLKKEKKCFEEEEGRTLKEKEV